MSLLSLPKLIDVELDYSYMESPIVYTFPRLRKKDAELDEREKMLLGRKMKASDRLAALTINIVGLQGFEPRGADPNQPGGWLENDTVWQNRVAMFFDNEDGQELADDALLCRRAAVNPQAMFRRTKGRSVAEHLPSTEPVGSQLPLSDVRPAGEELTDGLPGV